jgi:hypothetical protein
MNNSAILKLAGLKAFFNRVNRPYLRIFSLMRNLHLIISTFFVLVSASAAAWQPPIGIPYPPFGIDETHEMYAGQAGYSDAGNGPYNIYVDNTHAQCSNSGPATHQQPRCDIPNSLSAGDVVEVHGGPYYQTEETVRSNGTASQPVFIRGIDDGDGKPKIDANKFYLRGSYFVFEGFDLHETFLRSGDSSDLLDHVAIRNIRQHDHPQTNGTHLYGQDVVFWNNEVDHNQGNDRHGTYVGKGSKRVWILDNYYHHNGGDGIQFCHGCTSNYPDTVYIGRNTMHSDRENGIDLKYATNVVISQNTIHSYVSAPKDTNWCFDDGSHCDTYTSGSDGAAVVIGSDGGPTNIWVIFNEIYDAVKAIRIEESGSSTYIIGNVIHDISQRGLALEKKGDPVYFVGNTLYNMPKGIDQYWREFFNLVVQDNMFVELDSYIRFESRSVIDSSKVNSNLFWDSDGTIDLLWRSTDHAFTSGSQVDGLSGQAKSGNIIANPSLNLTTYQPSVTNSPAVDAASNFLVELDQTYRTAISGGTSILKDFLGKTRSANSIDIGALEYGEPGDDVVISPAIPSPPSNLQISIIPSS